MNQRAIQILLRGRHTPLGPLSSRAVSLAARSPGPEGGRPPLGAPFGQGGGGPNLSPEQRRRMRMQAVEEEHREKTQKAPEFDAEEDTSFQGKFMFLKICAYSSIFVYICFLGNKMMFKKIDQRKARIEGRLDEFLQEEEDRKNKGLVRQVFGKIGGGEAIVEDGIDKTSLGGTWMLKDLNGKPFGSADLAGHYYLIYFGGTLCPDVCPLTLMKIMKAQKILQRSAEGK